MNLHSHLGAGLKSSSRRNEALTFAGSGAQEPGAVSLSRNRSAGFHPAPSSPSRLETGAPPSSWPRGPVSDRAAFTLVELIGVVAVICILALAVLPALLKQLDDTARAQEIATLKRLGNGLQSYVLTTRIIPGTNTIATDLAGQLGWSVSEVRTNLRGSSRVFLMDPNTRIGTNRSLPYIQTNILVANLPTNQPTNRFMIITSMRGGGVLPTSVTAGGATNSAAFQQIWESDDGVQPSGWTGGGDWSTILVERVDLRNLFVQVILNSSATNNGEFSVDDPNDHLTLPRIPFTTYLLQGTMLGLHTNGGALQLMQVVQGSSQLTNRQPYYPCPSFVFEKGAWRGKLFMTTDAQKRTGVDLQGAYEVFMSGALRSNAGGVTQSTLTWNLYNFMSNYVNWAAGGTFAAAKKTAVTNSFNAIKSDLSYYCK